MQILLLPNDFETKSTAPKLFDVRLANQQFSFVVKFLVKFGF